MLCAVPAATSSAMDQRPRSRQNRLQISVKDIYSTIEHERIRSQQSSRCQAIRDAHSHALYRTMESPRLETRSLPPESRPQTGYSRPPTVMSRAYTLPEEEMTRSRLYVNHSEGDASSSQTGISLNRPADGAVCIRSRSAVDREVERLVNSLSRQCCDVLGPKCCHQCSKVNRRECDNHRYEARFPSLHVSQENYATSVMVSKALPELSRRQIQDKVARGEIRHMQFRQSLETRREKRTRKASNSTNRDGKSTGTLAGDGGYTYFSNIRDLTNKIMSGKAGKSVSLSWKASQNQSDKPIKSFSDLVCPSFVSPKKVKEERKSMFTSSYAPPLLPTVCQSAEPAFFAGSDIPYKLRERLPEKLFLDSNEDFDWLLS